MSSKGKYGEPWGKSVDTSDTRRVYDAIGNPVCNELMDAAQQAAQRDRAIACVNALAGIDNPAALPEFIEAAKTVAASLLGALAAMELPPNVQLEMFVDAARKLGVMGEGKQ